MYYRSHKWVDIPETAYERRRELRVRENKHTVMLFDRKYQDIDTGKFDTDKIRSLNSCTIGEIFSGATLQNQAYDYEHVLIDIKKKPTKPTKPTKAYDDLREPEKLFTNEEAANLLRFRLEDEAKRQKAYRKARDKRLKANREQRELRELEASKSKEEAEKKRKANVEYDHHAWLVEQRLQACTERTKEPERSGQWIITYNSRRFAGPK